jgi:hypothetical protein
VLVDAAEGAEVHLVATVGEPAGDDGIGRIDLTVSFDDRTVLTKAQVRARFTA